MAEPTAAEIAEARAKQRAHLVSCGLVPVLEPRAEGWFPWPFLSLAEYQEDLIRRGQSATHREVWVDQRDAWYYEAHPGDDGEPGP
jgi:hypothetical protein